MLIIGNILPDENEILSRWREYFEDRLDPGNEINKARDVESSDWRRNYLVNARVSSCVEVWQNF